MENVCFNRCVILTPKMVEFMLCLNSEDNAAVQTFHNNIGTVLHPHNSKLIFEKI